jgi:UDP-N-acetyl-D-mannosaminuronic acid dehydrogenase
MMDRKYQAEVSIVGLGFVGLTLALAFATRGVKVTGYEIDIDKRQSLLSGESTFYEPNIDSLLSQQLENGNLQLLDRIEDLVHSPNVIITLGTPWKDESVDQSEIFFLSQFLAENLGQTQNVIIRSTVAIGTCRQVEELFKRNGCKASVSMCPERTIEGKAIEELLTLPQIIGSNSVQGRKMSSNLFQKLQNDLVLLNNPEEAELAKLICNAYRDTQFSFANEIATLGYALKINVTSSINAANHRYPRANIPLPGPVAGPCLEKDGHILATSILGTTSSSLVKTARIVNEKIPGWVEEVMKEHTLPGSLKTIGILGVAFKGRPETSDVRGSLAVQISKLLSKTIPKPEIFVWDPISKVEDCLAFGLNKIELVNLLTNSDVIILQNNHPYFSSGIFKEQIKRSSAMLIIDLWNQINPADVNCKLIRFGGDNA